ncbi:hypothetical protein ACFL3Q_14430 [Planctomycetota bacterium]
MMNTQTETFDTNQHLGISSFDSEESVQDISREDYASRALGLWSPYQTPSSENMADIHEDTINLKSEYQWLTCYVWLSEAYNVADIDPDTILLNGKIGTALLEIKDELQLLIARFSWSQIEEILEEGEFEFKVSGELYNGTSFEGNDTVTVIDEKKKSKG